MIYTVTLNPALDYVMKVPALSFDSINRSDGEALYYGGKGINISAVLTRLGIPNKALGFTAGFTGKKLEEMLMQENIVCDFNHLKNGSTRINVKIKANAELDINAGGPEICGEDISQLMKKLDKIGQGDYLVLAGSAPKTVKEDIYESIIARLSGRGVNFVVDSEGELLLKVLKYKPFLIKPNHHELGDLFGERAESDEEVISLAKRLREMGAVNVLVSRAEKGAILIDENSDIYKIGNTKGTLVNSVGCGDSMVAGFLAGYISKHNYSEALIFAAACSNATAYSEELATKEEIDEILRAVEKDNSLFELIIKND